MDIAAGSLHVETRVLDIPLDGLRRGPRGNKIGGHLVPEQVLDIRPIPQPLRFLAQVFMGIDR